jgi:hypothetical protein
VGFFVWLCHETRTREGEDSQWLFEFSLLGRPSQLSEGQFCRGRMMGAPIAPPSKKTSLRMFFLFVIFLYRLVPKNQGMLP